MRDIVEKKVIDATNIIGDIIENPTEAGTIARKKAMGGPGVGV